VQSSIFTTGFHFFQPGVKNIATLIGKRSQCFSQYAVCQGRSVQSVVFLPVIYFPSVIFRSSLQLLKPQTKIRLKCPIWGQEWKGMREGFPPGNFHLTNESLCFVSKGKIAKWRHILITSVAS